MSTLKEIFFTVLLALIVFIGLRLTVQSYEVEGPSMQPNFEPGQRILVSKMAFLFSKPGRGDVVIFYPPEQPKPSIFKQVFDILGLSDQYPPYIKRVIGLPGDAVEIENGNVFVNGEQLTEPYIKEHPQYTMRSTKIPQNQYFVLGDNRNQSQDSHFRWTVPQEQLVGKAWISYWPFNNFGMVWHFSFSSPLNVVNFVNSK